MKVSPEISKAHQLAVKAYKNAYAPYSKFHVGSAVKIKSKDIFYDGHNIENSSYGATVCAERVTIWKSISENERDFEFLVLVTRSETGDLPCAMCLQVMSEFFKKETPIYIANEKEVLREYKFSDLLPHQFDKSSL